MTRRVIGILCLALAAPAAAVAGQYSPWATAAPVEPPGGPGRVNTTALDGCPIQSPDGLSLYMASNRKRSPTDQRTDLDIWVAHRESVEEPWGDPENLGSPVNSTADDFCPTPVRGDGLFFVSTLPIAGVTCGAGDIFFTRLNPRHGWRTPEHLGCETDGGPNTGLHEQGPSYFETDEGSFLYFSSNPISNGVQGPGDIYASRQDADGTFGPPSAVAELNSGTSDIQPNVRKDGREVVFASNRDGYLGTQRNLDIWSSTREDTDDPWSAPVNLGEAVNGTLSQNESRPSFSWDARTLLFGRNPGPEGSSDIFVTTRTRMPGG